MPTVVEVVRQHGREYLERHGALVLPSHVRAVEMISRCRTPELGGHLAHCESCAKRHMLFHSCEHRACPQCGTARTARWLERQRELLLPVPYFHVVFTLPSELRRVVRSNQKTLLPVLFRTAYESLATLCRDPRYLGAEIGALAVLHTWTRTLGWHPHVHLLVPGGGLSADGKTWVEAPKRVTRYLVPQAALASGFRCRFMKMAEKVLPKGELPFVREKKWVVFAKAAVQGAERVLQYVGRYVHKTAIGNHAVTRFDERTVSFRYTDSQDHQPKLMTLPTDEFLHRFFQHVPPKRFHRVRSFGLLHSSQRPNLRRIQVMQAVAPAPAAPQPAEPSAKPAPEDVARQIPPSRLRCPYCGKREVVVGGRLTASECLEIATKLKLALARAPPLASRGAA